MLSTLIPIYIASETNPVRIRVPRSCFSDFVLANYVGIDWRQTCKENEPAIAFFHSLMLAICRCDASPVCFIKDDGIKIIAHCDDKPFWIPTHDAGEACYLLCLAVVERLKAQPVAHLPPAPASKPDHESAQF